MVTEIYISRDFLKSVDVDKIIESDEIHTLRIGGHEVWLELKSDNFKIPECIFPYIKNIHIADSIEFKHRKNKISFQFKKNQATLVKSTNRKDFFDLIITGTSPEDIARLIEVIKNYSQK